jgi:enoyl-CoA hydratase/carnithine racemase
MADESTDPIRIERDGEVYLATLDDPPLGLFRQRTFEQIAEIRDEVNASDARAFVWRGAGGKVFSGGVDVEGFTRIKNGEEGVKAAAEGVYQLSAFERIEIPTFALVEGLCLTAALEAALACDMIFASETAKFGLVERVVALTPFGGGVQRMAERAGPGRAREFVYSGDVYDAKTMHEWGVVNRLYADGDELIEKGMKFVHHVANGPTQANKATKRIVRKVVDEGVAAADAATGEIAGPLFDTEDLKNAVQSFLTEGPGKATYSGR